MNSYSADWATKLYDLAHVHGPYLAASTIIWTAIYLASAPISRRVSATYRGLPFKLKMQWDNRIVAFLHAVVICYAAFWGLLCDEPLKADHLHAYSSWAYATMITACGYFIWDAVMCILYFKEFGLGFLLHALGCLFTFLGSLVRCPPIHYNAQIIVNLIFPARSISRRWPLINRTECSCTTATST
jgi:hypothetical protein